MNVSLTKELDEWVAEKVNSGLYKSSSEVIREGLRLLYERDEQRKSMLEDLKNELMTGVNQLESGKSKTLDRKLVDGIKRKSRQKVDL